MADSCVPPAPAMPNSESTPSSPGLGLGTTDHVVPLNCSVRVVMVPLPGWLWPTTQTSVADRAVIANSELPAPPPGLGVLISDQVLPSQCSTYGTWTPLPSVS